MIEYLIYFYSTVMEDHVQYFLILAILYQLA